jgi:hypothetical protein
MEIPQASARAAGSPANLELDRLRPVREAAAAVARLIIIRPGEAGSGGAAESNKAITSKLYDRPATSFSFSE